MNKFGLDQKTIDALRSVFNQFPQVENVIIYGSRAKGNYRDGSDIDITLRGKNLQHTDLLKIENLIEDLLLPYKIDLSLYHQIENPDLLDHIKRVGIEFKS